MLGPYKYLLKTTIPKLSAQQKEEVLALVRAFNYSGFDCKLQGNVIRYHQSFVGRDYKAWAQMAPAIMYRYLQHGDKVVWIALSRVRTTSKSSTPISAHFDSFRFLGLLTVIFMNLEEFSEVCREFADAVHQYTAEILKKQKVHLMLHLVKCMKQFGPCSSFNSERYVTHCDMCGVAIMFTIHRCETFNSYIRAQNIYGNESAPSHDIACHFAVIEQLRHICEDGHVSTGKR